MEIAERDGNSGVHISLDRPVWRQLYVRVIRRIPTSIDSVYEVGDNEQVGHGDLL